MTTIQYNPTQFTDLASPAPSHSGKTKPSSELLNSPEDRKLRKAATQFESLLLSTLWKSMKSSFASDDDSTDPAHDTLDQMGIDAMTGAVAKAGGVGIGRLILKHLEPRLAESQNGYNSAAGKVSPPPADIPK